MAKFNPKEYSDGYDGGIVPAGTYIARIDRIKRKLSQAGNEYFEIQFRLLSEYKGRCVWDRCVLTERSLWRLAQLCDAVGQEEEFDLDSNDEVGRALVGRLLYIDVEEEQRDGRERNKVGRFWKLDEDHRIEYADEERDWEPVIVDEESFDSETSEATNTSRDDNDIPF